MRGSDCQRVDNSLLASSLDTKDSLLKVVDECAVTRTDDSDQLDYRVVRITHFVK